MLLLVYDLGRRCHRQYCLCSFLAAGGLMRSQPKKTEEVEEEEEDDEEGNFE